MKRKSNTKTVLDILASRISLLILGGITLWLGYLAAEEMHERYKIKQEITRLKEEIITLERKNNDLASLINSFDDPETIELEAKKRLNLKKPGEEVAVIVGNDEEELGGDTGNSKDAILVSTLVNTEDSGSDKDGDVSNPIKWWRYVNE